MFPALFISELVRVVEAVYPGEIKVSAMQIRKQFLSTAIPQKNFLGIIIGLTGRPGLFVLR